MEDHRELLVEIRDAMVRHAQVHAEWVEHQRRREAEIDAAMTRSLAMQQAHTRFYRRTILVGIPLLVIIGTSVIASLSGMPR